jgi:hypothetical protein
VNTVTTSTFTVDLYSQAYTDGSTYAYLYQLSNLAGSHDPIELFTLSPFYGATDSANMGYLTGSVPAGFLSGTLQNPEATGYINTSGQVVSFYFTSRAGRDIEPGKKSDVLYVVSAQEPSLINGNVIDGSVGSALVSGPVPEPGTLILMALGGLAAIRRRRAARS